MNPTVCWEPTGASHFPEKTVICLLFGLLMQKGQNVQTYGFWDMGSFFGRN